MCIKGQRNKLFITVKQLNNIYTGSSRLWTGTFISNYADWLVDYFAAALIILFAWSLKVHEIVFSGLTLSE